MTNPARETTIPSWPLQTNEDRAAWHGSIAAEAARRGAGAIAIGHAMIACRYANYLLDARGTYNPGASLEDRTLGLAARIEAFGSDHARDIVRQIEEDRRDPDYGEGEAWADLNTLIDLAWDLGMDEEPDPAARRLERETYGNDLFPEGW